MNPEAPLPEVDEDLEALRAKLKAQRAVQKASLAKHKRTTFMAVETAQKGTTYFDPAKLKAKLDEEGEQDDPAQE